MDPYKVLGIGSDATDAEVKKAYRALAKKVSPRQLRQQPARRFGRGEDEADQRSIRRNQKQRAGGQSSSGAGGASGGSGAQSGNTSACAS